MTSKEKMLWASSSQSMESVGPYLVSRNPSGGGVLFPQDGITKGDLIDYYLAVSDVMLPMYGTAPFTCSASRMEIEAKASFQKEATGILSRLD